MKSTSVLNRQGVTEGCQIGQLAWDDLYDVIVDISL